MNTGFASAEIQLPLTQAQTLEEIISWGKSLRSHKYPRWLFRGQSHDWALRPSIFRTGTRRDDVGEALRHDPKRDFPDEEKMLENFKRYAPLHLDFQPKDILEWMAIAQHHGIQTRLLDWSENILVAIFHACEKMGVPVEKGSVKKDGFGRLIREHEFRRPTIYAIPEPTPFNLHRADQYINLADLVARIGKNIFSYRPPVISDHIRAQSSIFTIQAGNYDFSSHDLHMLKIKERCDYKSCYEGKILCDLDMLMNINRGVLYPDLKGLAQSEAWRHKWQRQV